MTVHVDHALAVAQLEKAWADITNKAIQPPQQIMPLIAGVLRSSDVAFKYILVTACLAKSVQPTIHTLALQAGSELDGAYDARSLCHKRVVVFEKTKGNLFGLSNEPFGSKAARHPEHDKDNPQLRNKQGAKMLHNALDALGKLSSKDVYACLVYVMRLGKERADSEKAALVFEDPNLLRFKQFIKEFLVEGDGGARLAAVWGVFTALNASEFVVEVYPPNQADKYAKTTGDVEILKDDKVISSVECKHRPLNIDDVEHGIRKALNGAVPEYLFVYASGINPAHLDGIDKTISTASAKINVALIDFWRAADTLSVVLNPRRRGEFGDRLAKTLREMRRFESANVAAELWNKLMS